MRKPKHSTKVRVAVVSIAALCSVAAFGADKPGKAERVGERCWQDVRILAADDMEGRRAGSPAHRRAKR